METHFPSLEDSPGKIARARMMEDLQALVRDGEALLKATAEDASDKVRDARQRITAALDRAKATCAELEEEGVRSAKEALRKTDDTIRTHPYESIAVAFGIGILLGAFLRRK